MKPKLPIGIQSFKRLREEKLLYVDKTKLIAGLINYGSYFFLSRPRRFGKSLLLSTIKELFKGNQALFEGLWIADQWDWEDTHPVIHLSFSILDYQGLGLEQALLKEMQIAANNYDLILTNNTIKGRFRELIQQLGSQKRIVFLLDEYDKPLIDYIDKENLHIALEHQKVLKSFYSVLKDSDEYIKFLLITGVSKFSKVGVFSDLNNLFDISIGDKFATLLGYTQTELEHYFEPFMEDCCAKHNFTKEELLSEIKRWYNGYSWDTQNFVYNPFSVLSFFQKEEFFNFWFQTGTPTFLVELLKERFEYNFSRIEAGMISFESYDLHSQETIPLLFQTGYLTLKERERNFFILEYPNYEVKESMLQHLIGKFRHDQASTSAPLAYHVEKAFIADDIERAVELINSMFATIPYDLFDANKESYYHSLIHLLFTYIGIFLQSELNNSRGRTDMVLHTPTHIYVIEFKLDKSAAEAIAQIQEKGYAERFIQSKKSVVALGINFNSQLKKIEDWERVIIKA